MSELSPYNNDSGHIEISTFPLCKKTAQFINDSGIQCIRHFDLEAEQNCVNSEFNYFKNAYVTNKKDAINKELLNALEAVEKAEPLWLPHDVDPQYEHEEEALHKLAAKVRKAITNAKQVMGDKG